MVRISLDECLINFDKMSHKKINTMTLEETISLIFYAIEIVSKHDEKWNEYYANFQKDFKKQNQFGYPKLIFTRNDYRKRLDSIIIEPFIKSDNILLLLSQLIYIEKCKKNNALNNIYLFFERSDVLSRTINIEDQCNIDELSLTKLFSILEKYILFYIDLYDNKMLFEYNLSKKILSQLNN
jgi:hypothetical protein